MCGINGIVTFKHLEPDALIKIKTMNQKLIHRGPDSEGIFQEKNVILGMRRLKIIDLEGGQQPLFNEDESIVLVANGEIYNHLELREELENKNHRFSSHSDCEVIIHLYEEYGEDCIRYLRGMFAFALFDRRHQKVLLARDRLSEKPFYYYQDKDYFVFSSEMKSLLSYFENKNLEVDRDQINAYFHYQFVPEPYTMFKSIKKLPAAHKMMIDLENKTFSKVKYWSLLDSEPVKKDPVESIRNKINELSKYIIRSDVPVGVSLSGGIDSGAIAALAIKHYPKKMHAFSIGYEGRPDNDERYAAKNLSEKLGLIYHEKEISIKELIEEFPKLVYFMDDPIADIAAYGYFKVNELARENNVPVLLSGFGGDELFWGYQWLQNSIKINQLKICYRNNPKSIFFALSLLKLNLIKYVNHYGKKKLFKNPLGFLSFLITSVKKDLSHLNCKMNDFYFYEEVPDYSSASSLMSSLFTNDFLKNIDPEKLSSLFQHELVFESIPLHICESLFDTWLYANCIALGDRMSMAHSIEMRLPLLDYQFVEMVIGLKKKHRKEYQLPHKKWFVDAVRDILPQDIFKRKKRGFTPPVKDWYREVICHYAYLLKDGYLQENHIIDKSKTELFMAEVLKDEKNLFFAYKMILLEIWFQLYVVGKKYEEIKAVSNG